MMNSANTIDLWKFHKDYKNDSHLGHGGNGECHLWQRTESAKTSVCNRAAFVVVKTIRSKVNNQYPKEVAWMERLQPYKHPRIVEFIGFVEWDLRSESVRMMLEYCSGGDLHRCVARYDRQEKHFKEFELWDITLSILSALTFLHDGRMINGRRVRDWKPIIHCDIKPGNILCCPRPDETVLCKLADFGLSSFEEPQPNSRFFGTYDWQPPELPAILTPAADIWSVGAVLHYLVHREPPVDPHPQSIKVNKHPDFQKDEDRTKWARSVIPINIEDPTKRWTHWASSRRYKSIRGKAWERAFSDELNGFMMRMLATDAKDRPSAVELEKEMQKVMWSKKFPVFVR
ncbi:hypothetical protein FKW77_001875 [Venturia effusa]|uniref:non-specific serine/threonine protein kinase n=1 Tax=Venturia effusa TaxID=50376 RepID=A0A517LQR0_9PEZI|nr:hypothetical protein FKW77_001875 [Venturia effusa]